MMPARTFNTV